MAMDAAHQRSTLALVVWNETSSSTSSQALGNSLGFGQSQRVGARIGSFGRCDGQSHSAAPKHVCCVAACFLRLAIERFAFWRW